MQSSLVIKVMDELKTFLNKVNGTDDQYIVNQVLQIAIKWFSFFAQAGERVMNIKDIQMMHSHVIWSTTNEKTK